MSAKVEKKFEKRFELNEENIRRLHSDLRKRIPTDNQTDITFEVFREDSLVFRTTEIDRVLSESNDSTQKIKELKIEYLDDSLDIELKFDAESGAELTINGEDRDQVFLIASDLKEYIQKEICNISTGSFDIKFIAIGVALLFILLIFIMKSLNPGATDAELQDILSSTDTNLKLNYLIDRSVNKESSETKFQLLTFSPMLLMFIILIPGERIYNYFLPGNIFLIGKQISVIAARRGNIKNLFWCGIVAAVIAFGSGYYFLWMSK